MWPTPNLMPEGRFYWHAPQTGERWNTKPYSDPNLKVGLEETLKQVRFLENGYRARGARYGCLKR